MTERIRRTEKRIEQYGEEDRIEEAQHEMRYLCHLQLLERIIEEMFLKKSADSSSKTSFSWEEDKRRLNDISTMPVCAEKTIMELLSHFQKRFPGENVVETTNDSRVRRLELLRQQLEQKELFTEQIKVCLQELTRTVYNEDCQSAVFALRKILRKIRPLNVQEIQRLVRKAERTTTLISNQDIVLLVGVIGSGKSTTFQFLTGAKMKNTLVEIAPTKFLEHISIDGPITNPALANVITSPLSNSITQFLLPVTVQLKDLFGRYETGGIVLCVAPGFDDTSDAEADIADTFGVIQALKSCQSVEILALSSYKSLGDKGQGIQTLIRTLINTIHGIGDRLGAILYGFTEYPPQTDIHALLVDPKTSRVDEDPQWRSDDSFVTVLTDMINKTKESAEKISPVGGDPRSLLQKLRSLRGIYYPGEVIRFSIGEETKAKVAQQIHQYRLGIMCDAKQKDFALVTYYLDHFKMLREWSEQDFVEEAYADSKQVLSDHTEDYCKDVIERLSRILASQDRLTEEDIKQYTNAYHYLEQKGNLRAHFGSNTVSVELFTDQILSQLENRENLVLNEGALCNPSISAYLDNFHLLRKSFTKQDSAYKKTCDEFDQHFELASEESVLQLVSANEFQQLAEIILQILSCIPILNHHLNG